MLNYLPLHFKTRNYHFSYGNCHILHPYIRTRVTQKTPQTIDWLHSHALYAKYWKKFFSKICKTTRRTTTISYLKTNQDFSDLILLINQLTEIYNIIISNLDKGKKLCSYFVIYQKHFIRSNINVSSINYKNMESGGKSLDGLKIILQIEHKRLLSRPIPQELKALMLEYPRDQY